MFNSEVPILSSEQDILNRREFSEEIAKFILGYDNEEALVIGLNGAWGSGKTSSANMIVEYMAKDEGSDFAFFSFNPWMYTSKIDDLVYHYFSELAKTIEIYPDSAKNKKLSQKLLAYSYLLGSAPENKSFQSLFTTAIKDNIGWILLTVGASGSVVSSVTESLITQVNYFVMGLSAILIVAGILQSIAVNLSKYFGEQAKIAAKTVSELKTEIESHIVKSGKRILIVIDDIDRLNDEEIKLVLQLVRINADFTNTIFLIPLDIDVVASSIENNSSKNGYSYLEKIIQVKFDLPKLEQNRISKELSKRVLEAFSKLPESSNEYYEEEYLVNIFHSGFKNLFKNMRDVKRYFNSIHFLISHINRTGEIEVNPTDLLAVEAIRMFAPSIYEFVKNNKDLFTSSAKLEEKEKSLILHELSTLDLRLRDNIEKLLSRMFVVVKKIFDEKNHPYRANSYLGESYINNQKSKLKIQSTEHFDKYFLYGNPEGSLTNFDFRSILLSSNSISKLEDLILTMIENDSYSEMIERLNAYISSNSNLDNDQLYNFAEVFFKVGDLIPPNKNEGFFSFLNDPKSATKRVVIEILNKIDSDKAQVLAELMINCDSVYLLLSVFSELNQTESDFKFFLDSAKEEHLKEIVLSRLCSQHFQNRIMALEELNFIKALYVWKRCDNSSYEEVVTRWLYDKKSIVPFFSHFKQYSYSHTLGDFYQNKRDTVLSEELVKLVDFIDLKEYISQLEKFNRDMYEENDFLFSSIKNYVEK